MSRSISIKSSHEIELMRASGRLLAKVFQMLDQFIAPGRSTLEINNIAHEFIVHELHAYPATKGFHGFPFSLNTSVNDVVCHGIPSKHVKLSATDIINVDITLEHNGYMADSSKTYVMPNASQQARDLVNTAYQAMWRGIEQVKPGNHIGDIGNAIQSFAESHSLTVVRDYVGHGIGREMHEEPPVFHVGIAGTGIQLTEGMVITIEPMLNLGTAKTKRLSDGWTVVTDDGSLSAQFEHTVLVTRGGYEVLTIRDEEQS
ncbi:type I methionyl aminopeptidase [Vibrio viridaestus]|uniref:Methionine aminopeptidase n=1 Tax=Vibrio viridaestus TaxID=2487322 RepID=A0A3N9TCG0_9VIBR|nr:type I methionyl aminopeptidase [Vibrio viridaestus]RQW61887.1 type I methionyl aminopeptidase [Vibrio viridaestus]